MVERADDDRVDEEQRRRADDAADQRIVIADDRVLHRVRQQEQHDEIERVELRQLAFAGESESDEKEPVDDERPEELLENRNAGLEEFLEHDGWTGGRVDGWTGGRDDGWIERRPET